jgi:hypothetical protein
MEGEPHAPSPMSLGTHLNTPAPDVNQAASPTPGRNAGEQQQVGGGEPSFGMTTAATRLREWSAARHANPPRPMRFAAELPSPGHQFGNPLFGAMSLMGGYGDPYYGYGPAAQTPAPMHAPMHAPVRPPPPTPYGPVPLPQHTPYAQQPFAPQFQAAQWGGPATPIAGPTYRKRYDLPPGFSGATSSAQR